MIIMIDLFCIYSCNHGEIMESSCNFIINWSRTRLSTAKYKTTNRSKTSWFTFRGHRPKSNHFRYDLLWLDDLKCDISVLLADDLKRKVRRSRGIVSPRKALKGLGQNDPGVDLNLQKLKALWRLRSCNYANYSSFFKFIQHKIKELGSFIFIILLEEIKHINILIECHTNVNRIIFHQ